MNKRWAPKAGFTIVELLIVVVVIAILAAVTIVAFSGIQDRAKLSAMKADLSSIAKKLDIIRIQSNDGLYPTDLDAIGLKASGDVELQYSYDNGTNPPVFCITAVSRSKVGTAYRITQAGTVLDGACPGHSTNPGYTNLIANPGFESSGTPFTARTNFAVNPGAESALTYWSTNTANGATVRDTSESRSGGASIRTDISVTSSVSTQLWDGSTAPLVSVAAGEVVTISGWAKSSGAGQTISLTHRWRDAANAQLSQVSQSAATLSTSWTRFSFTATAPAGASYDHISFYVNGIASQSWWLDDVLVEKSTVADSYFDGSTAPAGDLSYAWNGTPQLSSSTARGMATSGYSSNRVVNVSSSEWAVGTGKSLVQYPNSTTSNDNYTELMGSAILASNLAPSTQYTIMGTVRLSAPLSGTLSGNGSRSFFVHLNGTGITLNGVRQAPNAAGVYDLRATFTTPAALSGYNTIRLYHGGYTGSGLVWWDNLALVQGDYQGPYFQ